MYGKWLVYSQEQGSGFGSCGDEVLFFAEKSLNLTAPPFDSSRLSVHSQSLPLIYALFLFPYNSVNSHVLRGNTWQKLPHRVIASGMTFPQLVSLSWSPLPLIMRISKLYDNFTPQKSDLDIETPQLCVLTSSQVFTQTNTKLFTAAITTDIELRTILFVGPSNGIRDMFLQCQC